MNRKDFGALIKALRTEQIDPDTGNPWTQLKLAEETGLSDRIIRNFENGKKQCIHEDELVALATAFRLLPAEWEQFRMAACGIASGAYSMPVQNPTAQYTVWETFRSLCVPAILHDSLYNVIGINGLALTIYDASPDFLYSFPTAQQQTGLNALMLLFQPELTLPSVIACQRTTIARDILYRFRATSFLHRHKPAYVKLRQRLNKNVMFTQCWDDLNESIGTQEDMVFSSFIHPKWGQICCRVMCQPAMPQHPIDPSLIHITTLAPCNAATLAIFADLARRQPHHVYRFDNNQPGLAASNGIQSRPDINISPPPPPYKYPTSMASRCVIITTQLLPKYSPSHKAQVSPLRFF